MTLSGMYLPTADGLIECHVTGLPWFRGTVLSDVFINSLAIIGSYDLLTAR